MSEYTKVGTDFDVNDKTTDYYVKNADEYVPYGKFVGYKVQDPRQHGERGRHDKDARHTWSFDSGKELEAWWTHNKNYPSKNPDPGLIGTLNVYKKQNDVSTQENPDQGEGQGQVQEQGLEQEQGQVQGPEQGYEQVQGQVQGPGYEEGQGQVQGQEQEQGQVPLQGQGQGIGGKKKRSKRKSYKKKKTIKRIRRKSVKRKRYSAKRQ